MIARADDLRRAARTDNGAGRPARGARTVHRALAFLSPALAKAPAEDQPDLAQLHARLLITLAFSEFEIHGMHRGRQRLAEARIAAEECGSGEVLALVHELQGLLLVRSGDLASAIREFDVASLLADHLDDADQAALLLNRGYAHLAKGDLPAARQDLVRSVELASLSGARRIEFKAGHNLGYAEFLSGNFPLALDCFARADALDAAVSRGVSLLDRARVLMEAGLLHEADEALSEAIPLLGAERANQDRAEALLARAHCALLRGDWALARVLAGRARRDFRRRGSSEWLDRSELTRWQALLASRGGPAQVLREINSARVSSGTAFAQTPQVSLVAAEACLTLGRVEQATRHLAAALQSGTAEPLSGRLHQHVVRAGVARAVGELGTARRELRIGLTTLARQQATYPSLDLRTAMATHGGRLAELDLRIALESGAPAPVFDSLERWRAMSHRRTAVTPPPDPELAALLAQLRMVTEEVRLGTGSVRDRARRRQQSLERAVRERDWRLLGDGRPDRPIRLTQLRAALEATDVDLISYLVIDEELAAVSIVQGRARLHRLAAWSDVTSLLSRVRADLDAVAGRLLPVPLRAAITSSLRRDLERIDRLILPDRAAHSANLVIVPSRTLSMCPWGMLPRRRARATTVSVSATRWAHGLRDRGVSAPGVIAVAGPGLPLATREVHDVAAAWPGGVAVDAARSSATSLAAALTTHELVHIAAHGLHNHQNPLFSSIRLAGGPLLAYDIPQKASLAGHVVLSACDLGLATTRSGGEVLGLTAALLSMGVRCVVSAISRVDDSTSYATMRRYHELLATGADSATALALADDGDPSQPSPFVCFGSRWQATPTTGVRSRSPGSRPAAPPG